MKAISSLSKNMHIWACLLSSHFQKLNSGRDLLLLNITTCICSGLFLSTQGEFLQSLLFINGLTTFYNPKLITPFSPKALRCCSFSCESMYTLCFMYTFMSANIIRKFCPLKNAISQNLAGTFLIILFFALESLLYSFHGESQLPLREA